MANAQETWNVEHSIEINVGAETIWGLFCDVQGWKEWNAGIEAISLEGPFADGTWFTMKPPESEPLRSRLVDVRKNECFVDETRVGELVVSVAHRLDRVGERRTRVTYSVEAVGPGAREIGPMIAADFPDVLAALAARATKAHA